ncbi:aldo-keto reductase family 1 member B1-like [Protopterus annectens]|uniref:aldo-keto reductase family 1 member B1-like n=1 Tax=Protopterus annectens TaxID=7888 RepID=UPI001CFA8119|nr:aldo-keto reductase family 1 member B1-like [Protopterus annectens]
MSTQTVRLLTGTRMPLIGLGTWKSSPGQVRQAVEVAIDNGYRLIDCAYMYQNEDEVGAGINSRIQKGVVKREDMFVVTKLWGTFHAPEDVKPGLLKSLDSLKLDYVDLYLMHSPMGFKKTESLATQPEYSDVDYVTTWKAMEKLVDEGLVKTIGVSNFNTSQLERLMSLANIKPVVNQVELHPYLMQPKLVQYCKSKGIILMAYSPFGSPDRPFQRTDQDPVSLLENPVINEIANKYGKTAAQVLLRLHVQRNIVVIPKSATPSRIVQNAEVFDFNLAEEDIKKLEGLNRNWRAVKWEVGHPPHKFYPFNED